MTRRIHSSKVDKRAARALRNAEQKSQRTPASPSFFGENELQPEELMSRYQHRRLAQAEAKIKQQPKLVDSPSEFWRLSALIDAGRIREVNNELTRMAAKLIQYWQQQLGCGPGRPAKNERTRRFQIGWDVHQLLPKLGHWIERKQCLYPRYHRRDSIRKQLRHEGCPTELLDDVMESRTAIEAACRYLGKQRGANYPDPASIARYYRQFRDFYDFVPDEETVLQLLASK